ncbi:helix-turn-helix transcriptional regulator [Chryseobacterium sp. G0201]|uniref:helix-turn-helix transcriptional regulator n=1 Tax=Chryseobacterium sp. G0201 TaxID=2487065 RepID=UPI000F4DE345|nr:hypothetical protein [Chryseobacterium sp. G0201]AZA53963.1 hypothetical protein EG348_13600 [Chryseobacterium sp. G0201]
MKLKYIYTYIVSKRRLIKDEIEFEKSLFFDIYTLVFVFILWCNAILNMFFLYKPFYAVVFIVVGFFMLSTFIWPNPVRFNRHLLIFLFLSLGVAIFYCDIITGKEAMSYLSYISLSIATAFFFDFNKDKYIIFLIVGSYVSFFLINIITDYTVFLYLKQDFSSLELWYISIYKTFEITFCTFVGMYFIHRKEKMIIKYYIEKEKFNVYINKTDKIEYSDGLYELAMSKNSLFITYFKSEFPDYFNNILQTHPNLISSELEICALIKINLSTKEIAMATNTTVRAVENKKYRIRRKFNLPSEVDLNLYIINKF